MFVAETPSASVIPGFDQASAAVFACACRLTGGDRQRSLAMLIDTFVACTTDRVAPTESTPFVDAARRGFLADADAASHDEFVTRVVADMHVVDHRSVDDVAAVTGQSSDATRAQLDDVPQSAGDELRRGEMWFDDAMRAEAVAAITDRLPGGLDPSRTRQRSRWKATAIVAVVAVAALLALTVWIRTGDRGGAASPLPTEPATTSTAGPSSTIAASAATLPNTDITTPPTQTDESTTSVPAPAPIAYILDPPPDGYAAVEGYTVDRNSDNTPDPGPYVVRLWASPEATHTTGRWLAMEHDDADSSFLETTGDNTQRLDIAGHQALLSTGADGVHDMTVRLDDGKQLELMWNGIEIEQISALVSATSFSADGEARLGPSASAALDGMDLLSSFSTNRSSLDFSVFIEIDDSADYSTADNSNHLSVASGPQRPNDLRAIGLLIDSAGDPSVPAETVRIGGRDVLVASLHYQTISYELLVWHAGTQTILLQGLDDRETVLAAAAAARQATDAEWQALHALVRPTPTFDPPGLDATPHSAQIGTNTTSLGSTWTFLLNDQTFGRENSNASIDITELIPPGEGSESQSSSESQLPLTIDPADPLTRLETPDATLLVVAFNVPTAAAFVRIASDDGTAEDVPIVAVPETTLSGAAYAFSETTRYIVELLDADGNVIQTLVP